MYNNKYSEIFPWNGSKTVETVYGLDNYYVENTKSTTGKCIIFFSGNGLYYPNSEEIFEKEIIKKNRYEWINISKSKLIQKKYEKIIFVRDIYKQWYTTGISETVNSIDKLVELLRNLTDGYEVITVGNSAGGYIATVIGYLLNASKIYSFCGQFVLDEAANGPIMDYFRNNEVVNKFFDSRKYINNKSKLFYFCSAKVSDDYKQYELIKNYKNIFTILFNSDVHGVTIKSRDFPLVLTCDDKKLEEYSIKVCGKEITSNEFSKDFESFSYRLYSLLYSFIKNCNRLRSKIKDVLI